jgi:hypothetical protein
MAMAGAAQTAPEPPRAAGEPEPRPASPEPVAEEVDHGPIPDPVPIREERASRPVYDYIGPNPASADYDAFAPTPPFRPRRNPAKLWTAAAASAAVLMLGGVAAVSDFGLPSLGPAAATAATGSALVLEITRDPERSRLESGNELFLVAGKVVNPTNSVQPVPQIEAILRDQAGKIVYQWPISAPVSELQPQQSANFNGSATDVPSNAHSLSLRPGRPG